MAGNKAQEEVAAPVKLDFAKNVKRNMAANALSSGIRLIFPFLNRTLFLWLLSPSFLGLNGLFSSILGVLALAELGFGTAVVCSMYKPVADDDRELLCAYLKFYRTVYRCVGAAIFAIGLALLPFLDRLVHGTVPLGIDLHILYVIHLVNTAASYFLFAYRGVVLGAHHRNDVITNIRTAVSVAQYVAVFLILLVMRHFLDQPPATVYYCYVLATVVFTVAQNVLLVSASRRLFPDIEPRGSLPSAMRRHVMGDVKSIFMHKVGGVVTHSTDNLVISAFLGLVAVAAYGNYYYVVTSVSSLVGIFYSSMNGGFGNKIYTESKADNFRLLMRMNRLAMAAVLFCAAMMVALYQPFMLLWVKGNPDLVRHSLTPLLMVLYFYIMQSRQVLVSFKAAASLWSQDRWKPIVAGSVNLCTNILFVIFLPDAYKLDGVILSTILSFMFIQIPWETHIVFSEFFSRDEARLWWRSQISFALSAVALCAATCVAARLVPLSGVFGLAVKGVVAFVVSTGVVAVLFREDMMSIVRRRRGG